MQTDVLVIGCGIAGATAALELSADRERQITVITRAARPDDCNSSYAQGGIAGRGDDDRPELLGEDVMRAGAGLSSLAAVELLARNGPDLLRRILVEQAGLEFDSGDDGQPLYALEAAHSRRRILHVGDTTGRAIMKSLLLRLNERSNVDLRTGHTAVDLLTLPGRSVAAPVCRGAHVFDRASRKVVRIVAEHTVLATGGLGQIYLNTSNPRGSRGDGLAMAHRAGVRTTHTEYVQFHPTTLNVPGAPRFLISEAVRGEGATLLTLRGGRLMERSSPRWKDLAPRDVVARAIYWEMLASDCSHVLLDIASHLSPEAIRRRFPGIHAECLRHGIDITREPIPVAPAAHYSCGGVTVDGEGRSSLPGLYSVGEVSCTGVHGANRLAGTSLLEGLVWGSRAAQHIRKQPALPGHVEPDLPSWNESDRRHDADPGLLRHDVQSVRELMWRDVGLLRSEQRLERAVVELRRIRAGAEDLWRRVRLDDELIGLRNAVDAALIVSLAARRNSASRGCHYRENSLAKAVRPRDTAV